MLQPLTQTNAYRNAYDYDIRWLPYGDWTDIASLKCVRAFDLAEHVATLDVNCLYRKRQLDM